MLWKEEEAAGLSVGERLSLLEEIPDGRWGEIYILGKTPKNEAVRAGLSIASTMAELLRALLPIYRAAVTIP